MELPSLSCIKCLTHLNLSPSFLYTLINLFAYFYFDYNTFIGYINKWKSLSTFIFYIYFGHSHELDVL